MFQRIKSLLRDQFGIPPVVILVAGGTVAHLLLNALLRKAVTSPWGLLAPLSLGIAIETYEIWIQYRDIGLWAPGNDPVPAILGRHGLDVLVMLAGPLLLVCYGAWSTR